MKEVAKKFFLEFDMFRSYATFRTKGKPDTRNICGGMISFLLLCYFTYVFTAQLAKIADWQGIQSVQTLNSTMDPNRHVNNFMVGVGLQGFRIEGIMQFLRFQIKQVTKKGSKKISSRTLKTEKCKQYHWQDLGEKVTQNFNSYNLVNKLCLVKGQDFRIERPSNGEYRILTVEVNACRRMFANNDSFMYENCADSNLTQYKNDIWVKYNKYFVVSVVYLNKAFNSLNKDPTNLMMESVRLTFTITQGSEAFVDLATYEIQTDKSILPLNDYESQRGYSIDRISTNTFQVVWYFEHASCTFALSSNSILIQRSLGKIDSILSFVGGLFGIIISFLSIFILSFNEIRYQLMAAQNAIDYDDDGKKIKQNDFHFMLYVKYQIFEWVKTLFCIQLNWNDCKQIDKTRIQAKSQLQVALMFKKMQYFQRFIQYIISDREKIGLFLTEPPSLEEVKRNRMIAQYYDNVMLGDKTITMEDLNKVVGLLEIAMSYGLIKVQNKADFSRHGTDQLRYSHKAEDTLEDALRKFQHNYEKGKQPQLTKQELALQKQIAQQFFSIPDNIRKKIQRKIPLKILNRLHKSHYPTCLESEVNIIDL